MSRDDRMQALETELIEAVYDKQLRRVLASVSTRIGSRTEQARVRDVEAALDAFDAGQAAAADRVVGILSAAGVDAVAKPETRLDGHLTLRVRAEDSPLAIQTVLGAGFLPMYSLSSGAERARRRVIKAASFTAIDDSLLSLRIEWGDRLDQSTIGRLMHPGLPDLALLPMPSFLWWVYWIVKPFRVAKSRVRRRPAPMPVPFLGTPRSLVASLLAIADTDRDDVIVDLGCGDGRVLIDACSVFGCRGRGVESDPRLVDEARMRVADAGLADRISIELGDIRDTDLSGSTIGFAFLPARVLSSLLPAVLDRAPAGFRLVAHELDRIQVSRDPELSRLIVSPAGVTVAHLWRA